MGCVSSKVPPIEEEPIGHVSSHVQLSDTAQKQTNDSLSTLINDGEFQAQITERSFQIYLHEGMPDYWKLQYDLLIVLKSIFDRVKPRSATVFFPNRPLRYPTGDAEALLKLTRIETLHQGIQLWTEYLIQAGSLQHEDSDWRSAFQKTREGYRFNLVRAKDDLYFQDNKMSPRELHAGRDKRSATEEMTKTVEDAYSSYNLVDESSNEALKEKISLKARDLLPRYMEPVPLSFAVYNYENLMKISYDAGTGISLTNVVLQAFTDAKHSSGSGLGSKVDIIVVKGTVPQTHMDRLSQASVEVHKAICRSKKSKNCQRMDAHGICFVSLPNTGAGNTWRKLTYRDNRDRGFCNYIKLPTVLSPLTITGDFLRRMLLGSVVSTAI